MSRTASFDELQGKTIIKIEDENGSFEGINKGTEELRFICSDGSVFRMYHSQSCCESVSLEDIVGDLKDLIGYPVCMASVSTKNGECDNHYDSYTWTFYNISTVKGSVNLRWYGTSNGYYSEDVDFMLL